jgi:hypothetical protein
VGAAAITAVVTAKDAGVRDTTAIITPDIGPAAAVGTAAITGADALVAAIMAADAVAKVGVMVVASGDVFPTEQSRQPS